MKEKLAKKAAAAALQSVGVPAAATEKAMDIAQSELGKKALNAMGKMPGGTGARLANKLINSDTGKKKKAAEDASEGGYESSAETGKILKYGLMFCAIFSPIILICCLFFSAVNVFLNAISLGMADSVTNAEVQEKIDKKGESGLDEEKTDEDVAYDIYINDINLMSLKNNKLREANVIQVADEVILGERKYNEADLAELEDFYPPITDYAKKYDKNMVYDFFFKMYNLNKNYLEKYKVNLDLPLLMATLNLQSDDKNVIFSSNLSPEDRNVEGWNPPTENYDYYYDWINSDYRISKNNSQHDMEVLAQNMISKQVKEKCVDESKKITQENILKDNEIGTQTLTCAEGETYETEELGYKLDNEKYKEFLRQFIEKKYYLEGEHQIEGVILNSNSESFNTRPATGDFRNWTQCGQSWSSITVPKSSSSMCKIGCLITSVTIQIARSGTAITTDTIDPGIAVKKYNFASGGNFYWTSTTNIAPNFVYLSSINLTGMTKQAIAAKLTSYDPNKYYIVLAVSKKNKNKIHHYVALDYVDNSTSNIYIMDPAGLAYTDLYARYKLYKAHVYEKKD